MAAISRKELKKDRFRETMAQGAEAVLSHQRTAWIIGIAAVLVIGAVLGWRFYSERQAVKAAAALEEAMDTWEARIRALGEPEQPNEVSYVEEKNKYEDAQRKFFEVAAAYPRTRAGQVARYYAGLSLGKLERNDEAERAFREVERSGQAELTALARFQLAQLYERTGKPEEAVKLYQELLARPAALVPKPMVLLALASHHARSNPEEAARLLEQIKTEFPNTAASDKADEKLLLLRGS